MSLPSFLLLKFESSLFDDQGTENVVSFIDLFSKNWFLVLLIFLYCFSTLYFIYFSSNVYYLLYSACIGLDLSFFLLVLKWKLQLLIRDLQAPQPHVSKERSSHVPCPLLFRSHFHSSPSILLLLLGFLL